MLTLSHHIILKSKVCYWLFLLICLVVTPLLLAQDTFRIMFYNVENLFDCKHDTLKKDKEYLPGSIRGWHYGRYKQKINQVAKVITAVGEWDPPALVGLCEVENATVMDDLVKYSPLKQHQYRYIMTDSPDERGIDVALLWQRGLFRLLDYRSIRIDFKNGSHKPTRDILHAVGLLSTGDSLDVFVCHLPSRSGGEKESEPYRILAATVLKQVTDSLFTIRSHPNILIMGDFNDYPTNSSISKVLKAVSPGDSIVTSELYNLMADKGGKIGTYSYQGEWGILDQLIVSGFLLRNLSGFHTSKAAAGICNLAFLLEEDEKYGGLKPFRTYYGMKYTGGYSDHLPVKLDFILPK